jgi:cell division protein FtsI/penicillin-binding protein 2
MGRKFKSGHFNFLHHDIPAKANRILNLVSFALLIIIVRIWCLAFIQYDQKLAESQKPQKKIVIEPAIRSTIRDRFNLPLAINKVQYQAAVLYSQIQDIPSFVWTKDENGKKIKKFKRKDYIRHLAELLGDELNLDSERIEDLIHSKASYYARVPFLIKDELTEKEYYRLKMLAKDLPGLYMRKMPKRHYPLGRTAADVIGYMGAINRQEYEKILHEMKTLRELSERGDEEDFDFPPGIVSVPDARQRLKDLEEKTYTIHDYIGKTGIEGMYEKQLRGFYGKKIFYSDSKGHFLRELPGSRPALSGYRILLSLSAELQEYAEQLLAQNEAVRLVRLSHLGAVKKTVLATKHPWIKGGSIVVMDPHTGEILTLASYPRFDPNDFIASSNTEVNKVKNGNINHWFENETYLADIWNRQQPWERERYDEGSQQFYDEQAWLSWDTYLNLILPQEGILRQAMAGVSELGRALEVQESIDDLSALFGEASLYRVFNFLYHPPHVPYDPLPVSLDRRAMESTLRENRGTIEKIKKKLDRHLESLPQNYDKVLFVDLCRLAVDRGRFSKELCEKTGRFSLSAYKDSMGHLVTLMAWIKERSRELYHDTDFKAWRKREERDFLKQKRAEETLTKSYPKPYLDYLDKIERQFFQAFWDDFKWDLLSVFLMGPSTTNSTLPTHFSTYSTYFGNWYREIKGGAHQALEWKNAYISLGESLRGLTPDLAIEYLKTMRSYGELNRPLLGRYSGLRGGKAPLEKNLAGAFYPLYGSGHGRSYAYRQAAIQGSIFKLVTAYEALVQNFKRLNRKDVSFAELNPLTIIDQVFEKGQTAYVGYMQDGKPIPQIYKGGRVPRSLARQNNGEVDLIKALEVSSNPYFSLLAGECMANPEDLPDAARLFSFGSRTGIDLPGEIAGKVPDDVSKNRTGLYSLAIGQHSLVVTPLQAAVMLSAIANGGKVLKPKIVNLMAGRQRAREIDPAEQVSSLESSEMDSVSSLKPLKANDTALVEHFPPEIKRRIFMPPIVRLMLLKGLQASCKRTYQESLTSLSRLYHKHPEAIKSFSELRHQILGKTSTSESVEMIDLDKVEGRNIYTHVWFGSIAFNDREDEKRNAFIFKDDFGEAEVVVVVYLRYGGYGKEAAPLAAQIVKKWRELKHKYGVK